MTRLLKTEWLKHSKSTYTLVVLGITMLVYLLLGFTFERFLKGMGGPMGSITPGGVSAQFPYVWYYVPWAASYFKLFPGLILIQAICMEFSNRTARQHIIDGMSRRQFVMSKLLTVFVVAGVITLAVTLIAAVVGLVGGSASNVTPGWYSQFILLYFYELCCYLSFVMMLSFLFRRSLVAVLVLFLYVLVVEFIVGKVIVKDTQGWFPLGAINHLVHDPIIQQIPPRFDAPFQKEILDYIKPGLYALLFIFVSFWRFEKSNL